MEPFNTQNSRREWRSGIATPVVILVVTLLLAIFTFTLLYGQANASLGVRLIAGGLLGLLLVLDSFVIYQQVDNNRIRA